MDRRRFLNLFGMGAVATVAAPMMPAPKLSKRVTVKVTEVNHAETVTAFMNATYVDRPPVSRWVAIGESGPEMTVPTKVHITMPTGSRGEDVVALMKDYEKRYGPGWRQ